MREDLACLSGRPDVTTPDTSSSGKHWNIASDPWPLSYDPGFIAPNSVRSFSGLPRTHRLYAYLPHGEAIFRAGTLGHQSHLVQVIWGIWSVPPHEAIHSFLTCNLYPAYQFLPPAPSSLAGISAARLLLD